MGKKGRRFEHTVAKELTEELNAGFAWPVGYSGNGAQPAPDIITVTPSGAWALELKKTSQDTFGVAASDLRQLLCVSDGFIDVMLVVKFSNRESVLVRPHIQSQGVLFTPSIVWALNDTELVEQFIEEVPDAFDARCSTAGNEPSLRLSKPPLDDWPSAQSGMPAAKTVAPHIGASDTS